MLLLYSQVDRGPIRIARGLQGKALVTSQALARWNLPMGKEKVRQRLLMTSAWLRHNSEITAII